MLADKGYDANDILDFLKQRGARACIPPKANRKFPQDYDRNLYKERNLVERFFNRLKHYRRIATRYEKTARNFMAMLTLASILIWLA